MLMLQSQPAETVSAGAFPAVGSPRADGAVELDHFDSTDMRCWLTRGRSVEQATELARIWRSYPDLSLRRHWLTERRGAANGSPL